MIASFGDKQFEVSTNKILTPSNISFSESLNLEEQERAGDKPAIYVKGLGALSLSLNVKLDARWVDVQQEIVYWLVKCEPRYLNSLRLAHERGEQENHC